jgi:MoxR-like ATPase
MAIQTLTCQNIECGKTWTRIATVGRPPLYCDDCKGKAFKAEAEAEVATIGDAPVRHKEYATVIAVAKTRIPVMLVGPAGSGKTTIARQIAEDLDLPHYIESCNPQMTKWDLMGFVGPNGNYVPGIIRDAFEHGGIVLLDEMDASNPALLVSINNIAACSVGETVNFPDGTSIPKHEDFILIAGCNTFGDGASEQYVGREVLDAATLDRFACIEFGYDEALERRLAGDDMREWVGFVQAVRATVAELGIDLLVTPRATINGAKLLRAGMDRKTVEALTVWKGVSPDAKRSIVASLAQRQRFAS